MRLLSQGRTAFAPRFFEIKERDLTLRLSAQGQTIMRLRD